MDDVGDEVNVALAASSPCVHAERLFHCKAQEQQLGVVDVELVCGLSLPCAFLQICVVPASQYNNTTLNIKQQIQSLKTIKEKKKVYLARHVANADSGTFGPHKGKSPLHLVLAFCRAALSHSSRPRASLTQRPVIMVRVKTIRQVCVFSHVCECVYRTAARWQS